jgi:hypothetical protein
MISMLDVRGLYRQMGLVAVLLAVTAASAHANDGGIAYGGSPGLLTGHPTITMTSEKILLVVGEKAVRVECDFVFMNSGKACTVRMGFPDEGYGAFDPDEGNAEDNLMKTPARTTFTSFKSYVNGKQVVTKLIRADKAGKYWHAKTVQFAAHQVLKVRDMYTQRIGGGIVNVGDKGGSAQEVGYVLHTGASWHGNIGRSEVTVRFETSAQPESLVPLALKDVAVKHLGDDLSPTNVQKAPKGSIVWSGPCVPTVVGKSLTFVRANWKPSKKDDIDLYYGYRY